MDNKDARLETRKESPDQQARLEALLGHLEHLLPDPAQRRAFRCASLTPPPPSVRLNPLIPQPAALRAALQAQGRQVPWCEQAFILPDSAPGPGSTLEYAVGALYIQAKAATLAVEVLDPRPGERILDLAAAPGGKATQIGAHLQNTGLLVANDPRNRRLSALVGNLERCGLVNTVLSQAPGTLMARHFHNYFDRVLLDAPCSGDGILRKDQKMLRYWSVEDARRQAQQQKGLLRAAFHMLRPGGILVYSTCSLTLEENEDVVLGLIQKFPDQVEILPIDHIDPTPLPPDLEARYPASFARIARVWPHLHDTEGACVARIRKQGETEWPKKEDPETAWAGAQTQDSDVEPVQERLEAQWKFDLPCPAGQILVLDRRFLHLRPREAAAFQAHYPFYVRAGMRVARCHKDHYYLSQQTLTMWGPHMQGPRLELTWPQVQTLFRGQPVCLEEKTPLKGEVVCLFGPWAVCRGLVKADGYTVEGMVPRDLRRQNLGKLT